MSRLQVTGTCVAATAHATPAPGNLSRRSTRPSHYNVIPTLAKQRLPRLRRCLSSILLQSTTDRYLYIELRLLPCHGNSSVSCAIFPPYFLSQATYYHLARQLPTFSIRRILLCIACPPATRLCPSHGTMASAIDPPHSYRAERGETTQRKSEYYALEDRFWAFVDAVRAGGEDVPSPPSRWASLSGNGRLSLALAEGAKDIPRKSPRGAPLDGRTVDTNVANGIETGDPGRDEAIDAAVQPMADRPESGHENTTTASFFFPSSNS